MNPYLDIVDRQAPAQPLGSTVPEPAKANPYLATIDAVEADEKLRLRANLLDAAKSNPDQSAQAVKLGKKLDVVPDVAARNLLDLQVQDAVMKADQALPTSPVLLKAFREKQWVARQAIDDVSTLQQVEGFFRNVGGALKSGVYTANRGAAGVFQAAAEVVAPTLDVLEPVTAIGGNPLRRLAEGFGMIGAESNTISKAAMPKADGILESGFYSGVASIAQNALALPLAFLPGGQAAALTVMSGFSGGNAYQDAREKGLGITQALPYAASQAVIEYATEKLPLGALIKDVKVGTNLFATIAKQIALELPGEQVATVLQDLNEWAVLNPEKPFSSYLEARPSAAAQTLVATIVGSGGNIAIAKGIESAVRLANTDGRKLKQAEDYAAQMQALFEAAANSKLRERNPETFAELVQQMADETDGAPKSIFIDAEVLQQAVGSIPVEELTQTLPSVAAMLTEGVVAGSLLEVPIGEALAAAPGTPLAQTFLDYARATEDAPTLAETKEAAAQAEVFLQQQADRILADAQLDQEQTDSADRVKQAVLDQITQAGNYDPKASEAYAVFMRAFYATQAQRLGQTPEQLFQRYPLRIVGAGAQLAGDVLNAPRLGEVAVEGYQYSKADRPVIDTAAFGTGLAGSNRDTYLNAPDQRLRKRAYFYVDKGTGINPEAGVGGRAMRAQLTNIYDSNSDPLRLKEGRDQLGFESAVLDAGFSGYLDRLQGSQSGQVILLGDQRVPAEALGGLGKTTGRIVPAPAARPALGRDITVDALRSRKDLPAGEMTREGWDLMLAKIAPEIHTDLKNAGVFEGEGSLYKDGLIRDFINRTAAPTYEQSGREAGDTRYQDRAIELMAKTSVPRRSAVGIFTGKQKPPFLATNFDISRYFTSRNAMEDYTTPAAQKQIVDALYADTLQALTDSGSAVGWYDRKVTAALDLIAELHPEIKTDEQAKFGFIAMLAITSNSTRVNENFEKAEALYRSWKESGTWPTDVPDAKAADAMRDGLAKVSALVDQHGWQAVRDFMVADKSIQEIADFTGVEVASELRDTKVYGAVFLGSKIGAFFNNLYGNFTPVTMDRWFMRTINRVRGNMLALPQSFGRQLELLSTQLATGLDTYGVPATQLQAEIAAYQALGEDQQGDVLVVLDTVPGVLQYAKARNAEYAKGITDANGKKRSYAVRSAENVLAKNLYESMTLDEQTPGGGKDRKQLREIMVKLQQKLQRDGIPIVMADLQAVLWYYEKDLFARLKREGQEKGLFDGTAEAEDYETAARRVVERARGSGAGSAGPGGLAGRSPATGNRAVENRVDTTGSLFQAGAGGVNDGQPQPTGDRGGRYTSGSLAPLEGAPTVQGGGPIPDLVAVAEQYARANGITLRRQASYAEVDVDRATRIAQAYADMQHAPQDPAVAEAYQNLIQQTTAQYQALVDAGYSFTFFDSNTDPYAGNPWNAMRDLRATKTMGVFATEAGFGSGATVDAASAEQTVRAAALDLMTEDGVAEYNRTRNDGGQPNPEIVLSAWEEDSSGMLSRPAYTVEGELRWLRFADWEGRGVGLIVEDADGNEVSFHAARTGLDTTDNPLLADTGITWPGPDGAPKRVLANDLFRAVHDAFGHGLEGAGFRAQGEENAWQAHVRLFTGSAVRAITTETRGQNSWLNFGPDAETNQAAKIEDTVFAEQKVGLLPEWVSTEGRVPDEGVDLEQGPRGTFSPSQLTITLNENADFSTFLHESGHFFLEVLADLGTQPGAPQQIIDDLNATLQWFGVKDDKKTGQTAVQKWNAMTLDQKRPFHERWAESFEQYLFEGKAPSAELRPVFQRFRSWLTQVYKSLQQFLRSRTGTPGGQASGDLAQGPDSSTNPLGLSRDIRQVMDRLLATDEQIAEAERLANFEAVFKSADEAGMTVEQWEAYQALNSEATNEAVQTLQTRSLRDMQWLSNAKSRALKKLQREAKAKRDEVEAEVTAEVEATPVEQARAYIRAKRVSSPEDRAALKTWREQRAAFVEKATEEGKAALLASPEAEGLVGLKKGQFLARNKKLLENEAERRAILWERENPRPTVTIPAVELEAVAEQFGYTSVDHLQKALADEPKAAEVIEGLTDQRMLERYGDLVDANAIERAANEAVHNQARARFVATELAAMANAMNATVETGRTASNGRPIRVNTVTAAAKGFADQLVNRRKIKDLKPSLHEAAERRAAKRSLEAQAKGDTQGAAAAKRDQLLNYYAGRYTTDARASAEKALDYLRKFEKEATRKALPPEYVDQIDKMLERFDLRRATTLRDIDKRASLVKWIEAQRALGVDPVISEELENEAYTTSYKELTVEQFNGLVDAVRSIEHLGRLKTKLLKARDKREFDAIANEIADTIRENGGKVKELPLEGRGAVAKLWKGFWADHRKLASLVYQMDGGVDNGPFYRAFVASMNEAGAAEDQMIAKATDDLAALYKPLLKMPGGMTGSSSKVYIPEINASLTRAGRMSVALNWGNPANRQRLLDGDNWTEAQALAVIKTLSRDELAIVNKAWEYLDSFWPEIKAKQLRVTGVVEEKVEAVPFEVELADGSLVQMRGGYYPIKYDTDRSIQADKQEAEANAKEILNGARARPTTRRGHTKARADEVKGRPVRKDLNVITQHVTQVVHDLAWHEWFIDANRLLNDPRINTAIRDHYGPDILRTMLDNTNAIATGDIKAQTFADQILLKLRANISRSVMGASLTTAILQPFGLTQSMARIGVVPVLKGAARWAGDAARMESSMTWIAEKSPFMANRAKTFNRELREINQRVGGKSKALQVADASLFYMMQKLQMVADVPTWIGAYEKALAEGLDEQSAVGLGDQAVLGSQGGGTIKDLSRVQRNMPFLTQFYSYFNTTYNLVAEKTGNTDFKNPRAVAGWLADMALLTVVPAILPALVTYLLKGGDAEEPEEWAKKVAEWQASYLFGMAVLARELPTIWSPFDYQGPPAGRILGDAKKVTQQVGQGEVDDPLVLAVVNLMGSALGLPTVQLTRSYKGWVAYTEGDAPATSILFGPPPKD